jgi:uncharacterized protein
VMKRVFIIHGWAGNPTINWFPWLKSELEKIGIEAIVLSMPDSEHPVQKVWVEYINKNVLNPDENTFFVGHSLGGISILRYLETISDTTKIGGIVLVASFALPIGYPEPDSFCQTPVDFGKIKKIIADKVTIINSDNDVYVSNETAQHLYNNLGGKFISIHNGGHLTGGDGYVQFPEVLNEFL